MARIHWPILALSSLPTAALLLLRNDPISPAYAGLLLLLWPWVGSLRRTLLLLVALTAWMAWTYQQQWQSRMDQAPLALTLQGQVSDTPSARGNALHFGFLVDQPNTRWHKQLLRVSWYRDAPVIAAQDCWLLELRLKPAHGFANPGSMDFESWLFREAYLAKATVRQGTLCGHAKADVRQRVRDNLLGASEGRAAATLAALLLGDRSGLEAEDWTVLRRTGTSHLFAISGLHVGLIAALGWGLGGTLWSLFLYRYLPRKRDLAIMSAALFAVSYAALSGFAVPAQRALIMCLLGLLALALGRQRQMLSLLAVAWLAVISLNPLVLMMPGLWLSFVAVLGIVLYLKNHSQQARWQQLLGIQIILSLLLLPLSMLFFGGVSLLAAPTNLLLVPLFGLLLPALLVSAVLHLMAWTWPLSFMLQLLDSLWLGLEHIAALPLVYAALPEISWWLCAMATLGVLLCIAPGLISRVLGLALFVPLFFSAHSAPGHGELRAWFWDVGQGQSVLLQTAHHNLLYDAGAAWSGGFDAGASIVAPALRQLGLKSLDAMVISHADKDHSGGAQAVAEAFAPEQRWGFDGEACVRGQSWQWDGVSFEFLHPALAEQWSDNNGSCVLQVRTAHGQQLLLTGDIEAAAELALLNASVGQQAVISVPHHGSASSSSVAFINALHPQLAVVSAGFQNRWGHPAADVLSIYKHQGSELLVTGQTGAVCVDMAETLEFSSWRQKYPRLWRNFSASFAR
ncbi:MAG: DNA internalization-related competence protein ComEC/Rec2 [Oceanococcus sp.]